MNVDARRLPSGVGGRGWVSGVVRNRAQFVPCSRPVVRWAGTLRRPCFPGLAPAGALLSSAGPRVVAPPSAPIACASPNRRGRPRAGRPARRALRPPLRASRRKRRKPTPILFFRAVVRGPAAATMGAGPLLCVRGAAPCRGRLRWPAAGLVRRVEGYPCSRRLLASWAPSAARGGRPRPPLPHARQAAVAAPPPTPPASGPRPPALRGDRGGGGGPAAARSPSFARRLASIGAAQSATGRHGPDAEGEGGTGGEAAGKGRLCGGGLGSSACAPLPLSPAFPAAKARGGRSPPGLGGGPSLASGGLRLPPSLGRPPKAGYTPKNAAFAGRPGLGRPKNGAPGRAVSAVCLPLVVRWWSAGHGLEVGIFAHFDRLRLSRSTLSFTADLTYSPNSIWFPAAASLAALASSAGIRMCS